jgi:aminopeptidase N
MVQSLRGSTYGYAELRSALEQECHQDLGPMFREWLTETGIPADFRQRYETKP